MKSFSVVSIVLVAASSVIVQTVYAAPVVRDIFDLGLEARQGDECTGLMCARHIADAHAAFLERRANPSATAKTAIDWLKKPSNSASINSKPLCFYSGYTEVVNPKLKPPKPVQIKAHSKLSNFMSEHRCNSIDNIVSLTGQSSAAKKWTTDPDWMEVSRALAQNVKGSVYVLLGKTVPSASVWVKAEKAALVGNKSVMKIEVYEIDDKGGFVKKANLKG